jgi:hypothetical protein
LRQAMRNRLTKRKKEKTRRVGRRIGVECLTVIERRKRKRRDNAETQRLRLRGEI